MSFLWIPKEASERSGPLLRCKKPSAQAMWLSTCDQMRTSIQGLSGPNNGLEVGGVGQTKVEAA